MDTNETIDLRAAGKALTTEAERQFPAGNRCVRCGFRGPYHAPANHRFQAPVHPFVRALTQPRKIANPPEIPPRRRAA